MNSQYVEKRSTLVAVPDTKTINTSVEVNTSAANAWGIVGNFAGFNKFITGLTRIEMTGDGVRSVRKKFFADGHVVIEQLNTIDNVAMVMTWSLIYTSLDINNLWASMYVEKITEHSCRVTWDIAGEPYSPATQQADFEKFLAGFAQAALENVKNYFEADSKAA
jgi:hypothetical protein